MSELTESLHSLSPAKKAKLDKLLLENGPLWVPTPGPQTEAYESKADVLFYGGAAGGGKTDLAIGLAFTHHYRSIIYRRESKQLQAIIDRITEINGTRTGFNSQTNIWRLPDRQLELGGVQFATDVNGYQGRPHSLKVFDEITHFLESQFRFLCGWLRTTKAGEPQRIVCTGNPPTDADGEWVVKYWGPWLDPDHDNPAEPGELRWYAMLDGVETALEHGESFMFTGQNGIEEEIFPKSRTFIPSSVEDNPFLMATDYKATLQALPEPLRSQMLQGDFKAGKDDNPWQVIPTDWVKAAQDRWQPVPPGPMDALGMDVARGGKDETILSARHGQWFAELKCFPGKSTPDGPLAASLAVSVVRDKAPIQIDIIGVGGSPYDHLKGNGLHVIAMNSSETSKELDKTNTLSFANNRAKWWWRMREALDPDLGDSIALPPDRELLIDLCTPRWSLKAQGILVESKEHIYKRIQRSPDKGDAAVYALEQNTKKTAKLNPGNVAGGAWL